MLELRIKKENVPAEFENSLLAAGMSKISLDYHFEMETEEHVFHFENEFKIFLFGMRYSQFQNVEREQKKILNVKPKE